MVVAIQAKSTTPRDAIAAAIFNWWDLKSNFTFGVEHYFSQVPDESILSINDHNIGLSLLNVRDYYQEFLVDIENDPFAKFAFCEYVKTPRIKFWIAERLGQEVRRTKTFRERLPSIKKAIRKNKTVKKILES